VFDEQGIADGFRKRILNAAVQHLGVGVGLKLAVDNTSKWPGPLPMVGLPTSLLRGAYILQRVVY
jgi:hypothetical protein